MRNIFFMAAMLCGIVLSVSCSKNDSTTSTVQTLSNLTTFNESSIPNSPYIITTYIETDSLIVGYNPIFFTIKDTTSNTFVNNASIVLAPLMTNPTNIENGVAHRHSGPTEQAVFSDSMQAYMGAFIPLHGSTSEYTSAGYKGWRMRMAITVNSEQYDSVKYDFSTKSTKPGTKFFTSVAGNDGQTYYIALVSPQQASQTNGLQSLEIAFYKSLDHNITFQTVSDFTIGNFYPYMPDMGHSSTSNVIPTSIGNGHYTGTVNFTMGGYWTLNFTKIQENNVQIIDSTALEVAF
ncbi:MAG: FixH family protein [Chitinophagaceae bacterium]